jgi:hypothetical protein
MTENTADFMSSLGSAKPLTAAVKPDLLARYTKVALATSARGDDASKMTVADRERIEARVAQKVKELAPNRFADFAGTPTDVETLHVTIAFTRYDAGSACRSRPGVPVAASSGWGSASSWCSPTRCRSV